jgi:ERCC4-related helicase
MTNPLIQQYGLNKLIELKRSPYRYLDGLNIEKTPHQIEAFLASLKALKTGGVILADEVGLGKTIEAGLVIKYLLSNDSKRIMIVVPPPLRKQWQDELLEKFDIESYIPESKYMVNFKEIDLWNYRFQKKDPVVIIIQYGMAPWFINKFSDIVWDCYVFDEAHRLRNLGNGAKMPQKLFNVTKNVPKLLLTATPLQNNLRELFALSQFIDEKIFVSSKTFDLNFVKTEDYSGLKEELKPILHRTLRKDVAEYLRFSNRECFLIDFELSKEEAILYKLTNEYLQRPILYAITLQNNGLVKMVLRKLLASSSFAVVETFERLRERLLILKQNTKVENAQVSLKGFFDLIDSDDDELEEFEEDDIEQIERERYRKEIDIELSIVEQIIEIASKITENSKSKAVIDALKFAFELQTEKGYPNKALIFTESKRTQKYLIETLANAGFDGILLFNGEVSDLNNKILYNAWRARNPNRVTNNPSIDLKQAMVEEFRDNAKILIATDVASEGLNLQFCDTVINYDLPWNPMKIEQRIGRCHRFGQKRDVYVFNLLNTQNQADKRVYEILDKKFNLFKGVFGASDDALGLLESGSSFERKILEIYDKCRNAYEFKIAFDKLEKEINAKRNKKSRELKSILLTVTSDEKKKHLSKEANRLECYYEQRELWETLTKGVTPMQPGTVMEVYNFKVKFEYNPDINNGYVFVGSLINFGEQIMSVLCMCNHDGTVITTDTREIVQAFKKVPVECFAKVTPPDDILSEIRYCYDNVLVKMNEEYKVENSSVIEINQKRLLNWANNQKNLYDIEGEELRNEVEVLRRRKEASKHFMEKIDIQKQIDTKLAKLKNRDEKMFSEKQKIDKQALQKQEDFKKSFEVNLTFVPNIVVKF